MKKIISVGFVQGVSVSCLYVSLRECLVGVTAGEVLATLMHFIKYLVARECHHSQSGRQKRDCLVPLDRGVL